MPKIQSSILHEHQAISKLPNSFPFDNDFPVSPNDEKREREKRHKLSNCSIIRTDNKDRTIYSITQN